jgi:TonB family protein
VDVKRAGDITKINKDAERTSDPAPELTAEMKKRSFNANLRVRVTVNADGSHEEELIQGSGDSEIDALVLKTMRRWKWRPALRDGEKVTNSQTFRYKISIND